MRLIRLTIAIAALVIVSLFGVPLMTAVTLAVPPCDCTTNKGHRGLWNDDYTDCNIDAECAVSEE